MMNSLRVRSCDAAPPKLTEIIPMPMPAHGSVFSSVLSAAPGTPVPGGRDHGNTDPANGTANFGRRLDEARMARAQNAHDAQHPAQAEATRTTTSATAAPAAAMTSAATKAAGNASDAAENTAENKATNQAANQAANTAAGTTGSNPALAHADTRSGDDEGNDDTDKAATEDRLPDEANPALAAGQLEGSLQAFVNSLQAPVVAQAKDAGRPDSAATNETIAPAGLTTRGNDDANGNTGAHPDLPAAAQSARAGQRSIGAEAVSATRQRAPETETLASGFAATLAASVPTASEGAAASTMATAELTMTGLSTAPAFGSAATLAATTAATTAATPVVHVAAPFQSSRWQEALGQQVLWIAHQDQQVASLTMNPPDLGPVRVTIELRNGEARASFVSLQPEVRQAIEEAVPRLKDMFADAGLQLQHANVSSDEDRRHPAAGTPWDDVAARRTDVNANDADAAHATPAPQPVHRIGATRLVDLFA